MSTNAPSPAQAAHDANLAEIVTMIQEIGGMAATFSHEDTAAFAIRLASLPAMLTTHTILIGVVPRAIEPAPPIVGQKS